MKRWIAIFGLVVGLGHGQAAHAEPTDQLRGQIELMLTAPEYAPTKAEWQALGPDAATVLREVVADRSQLALKRGRAATALSHFKSDSTEQVLVRLVSAENEGWLLRGKAARALATGFGERSLATLEPLLKNKNRRLREAAVRAIASVNATRSRDILSAHISAESSAHLRRTIEQVVARLEERLQRAVERAPAQEPTP